MAVVSVPGCESWVVARWAFRELIERSSAELADTADRGTLERAVALDGLHYGFLPADQGVRIAGAMTTAAQLLRSELLEQESADPRDAEFAVVLTDLISSLATWSEPASDSK
jgi:hypothetical protein